MDNSNIGVVSAKSSGIAILIDLFFPGGGLIYAGQLIMGLLILCIVTPLVWVSVWLTIGIGLIWYIPYLIIVMIFSVVSVNGFNHRNGITVR